MQNITKEELDKIGWKKLYIDINQDNPGKFTKQVILYNPSYMCPEDGFISFSSDTYYEPKVDLKTLEKFNIEAKHFKFVNTNKVIEDLYFDNKNLTDKLDKIQQAIPEKRNILWYLLKAKQIIELILSILNSPNVYTIKQR